ncbi:tRNA (guanosine(46)-N7)-methyltransferase TrmB [Cylindrospermopsis raciborskii CENA303]|uniref:tRNA (guanine-N(7)-)-methyltransferase n=1 Tax=Cylindrospermopsis raciborskii CENA303 TaxID=1170769 RepID=A0A1X4G3M0_9CYAN|nr:tRNA (guanosine(46)-N7)-methyltransferase TrmB [Cylindrospermopsis raciborskii]OSO88082.1 tRNA (guanosine(46)-N7)-methyltransferase TrmB [Cylindrospermopsis raciborskii CENA303]
MPLIRVRQHVNPLARKFQTPIDPPIWERVFSQTNQSLHLDIGAGRGRFLLQMAQRELKWNFLGLEIREPLVTEANRLASQLDWQNLHYLFCNVNNSLQPILSSLPTGVLQRVTIQFPDPWFKSRHAKRRVVQPQLVSHLANYLVLGGEVFIQSDQHFLATQMCDRLQEHPAFTRVFHGVGEWLSENPLVPTEREIATRNKGEPIYRALFVKT